MTNTLAYYDMELFTAAKSFIIHVQKSVFILGEESQSQHHLGSRDLERAPTRNTQEKGRLI